MVRATWGRLGAFLAPLLLVETDTQTTASDETPVVHLQTGTVEIGGTTYEQLTFVWWYPTASAEDRRAQGLRATLSGDGFPALYEVWGDASGARSIGCGMSTRGGWAFH